MQEGVFEGGRLGAGRLSGVVGGTERDGCEMCCTVQNRSVLYRVHKCRTQIAAVLKCCVEYYGRSVWRVKCPVSVRVPSFFHYRDLTKSYQRDFVSFSGELKSKSSDF